MTMIMKMILLHLNNHKNALEITIIYETLNDYFCVW